MRTILFPLAALLAAAACWGGGQSVPPNWPINPYWTDSPPPDGPGHKVQSFAELLQKAGVKENIGIKVSIAAWDTGEIGTFTVGDEIKVGACIGDKKSRYAFNHKGGFGGGLDKAMLVWMDETGAKELKTAPLDGGCG